ncbi:MAG TPA: hypothetical protein VID27_14160 [Blastocatellia bacterium]|jgi:hypothetical protein
MAKVKGTVINAWKNFLKERYGEDRLTAAIQSLDSDERAHLLSPVLDSSWYPMELQDVMSRLTKALASPSDKDLAQELGRYTADYVYTKVYRTVLTGSLEKNKTTDWLDDVLYQDLRRCVSEQTGPHSSVSRYYYLEAKPRSGQCRTLAAFLTRRHELIGRKNVTCVHQKCSSRGDDCCEFLLKWD